MRARARARAYACLSSRPAPERNGTERNGKKQKRGEKKKEKLKRFHFIVRRAAINNNNAIGPVSFITFPGINREILELSGSRNERLFPSRGITGNILRGIGVERGTHRRLIFLCSGATAERFTRQIRDHKMSDTKSNVLHRKTSEIIIGTFMGSMGTKEERPREKERCPIVPDVTRRDRFHCPSIFPSIYPRINPDLSGPTRPLRFYIPTKNALWPFIRLSVCLPALRAHRPNA